MKIQPTVWSKVLWQGVLLCFLATALALGVNAMRPDGLDLAAFKPEQAGPTAEGDDEDGLYISLQDAEALYYTKYAVFLDARAEEMYQSGHIEGALNLPWEEFEAHSPEVLAPYPPDTPFVTYCDGEACNLSKELAFGLIEKGYGNVRILRNGWTRWKQNGLPLEMSTTASLHEK